MADQEQFEILRRGVAAWNLWRESTSIERPDLSHAKLSGVKLSGANFNLVDLNSADLLGANLIGATLEKAEIHGADLRLADLTGARLCLAELSHSNLTRANLNGADLRWADLSGANLTEANLTRARLYETILADLDLSHCIALDSCSHNGRSIVDIRTLQRSGQLPLAFLRGVGLPDTLIDYLPSLLKQAIQLYSCFISYSVKDEEFVRRLHADLQAKGVRCWFAPEDMKIGAKILDTLDEAIRFRDKVLLTLSEASIASEWVEDEVTKAFAEERKRGVTVLFPIRLDNTVFETGKAWAGKLRDSRNIGDFRGWKDHDTYQKALGRVLRDLRVDIARNG
jgi:hypothetical protein